MMESVENKLKSCPNDIRPAIEFLREQIFRVADEENITDLEECLKWGQLSYVCKKGSTLRIDWKTSPPGEYAIYFNCNTRLIETFREIYPKTFNYVKNREIYFNLNTDLPVDALRQCIAMALKYHERKHLPLLGA